MKSWILATAGMLTLTNVAAAHQHCVPRITNILVLRSLSPNKVDPEWSGGNSGIGTGWSFVARSRAGAYLKGDIMSSRGNVSAKNVFVPANEWNCGSEADWQAGKLDTLQ